MHAVYRTLAQVSHTVACFDVRALDHTYSRGRTGQSERPPAPRPAFRVCHDVGTRRPCARGNNGTHGEDPRLELETKAAQGGGGGVGEASPRLRRAFETLVELTCK